jgi:hypothetical protein
VHIPVKPATNFSANQATVSAQPLPATANWTALLAVAYRGSSHSLSEIACDTPVSTNQVFIIRWQVQGRYLRFAEHRAIISFYCQHIIEMLNIKGVNLRTWINCKQA